MKYTINSPNNCRHINVTTEDGELFHSHLDTIIETDMKDLPIPLQAVKAVLDKNPEASVDKIKSTLEGLEIPDTATIVSAALVEDIKP